MKAFNYLHQPSRTLRRMLAAVSVFLLLSACAKTPYNILAPGQGELAVPRASDEPQISRGEKIVLLDGLGHYVISLPMKLLLWSWQVDKHEISPQTEAFLVRYLQENQMSDVRVRLNEYSPLSEFSRLYNNSKVGGLWRATLGTISLLFYTVLPGRLLGGDNYNPYTNTINLYSDHPAIALHEAGHAKDFMKKDWRGTYAALNVLPFSALFFESEASSDALSYFQDRHLCQMEADAYKILYPAYGTYVGGSFVDAVSPTRSLVGLLFVFPGHIVGRANAADVNVEAAECVSGLEATVGEIEDF